MTQDIGKTAGEEFSEWVEKAETITKKQLNIMNQIYKSKESKIFDIIITPIPFFGSLAGIVLGLRHIADAYVYNSTLSSTAGAIYTSAAAVIGAIAIDAAKMAYKNWKKQDLVMAQKNQELTDLLEEKKKHYSVFQIKKN